jgi:hypothetical protein
MAKVVCTVTYHRRAKNAKDKVTKTYEIQFDKRDKFEIKTATKNLVLKVERGDPAAKELIKRWKKTQRITNQPTSPDKPSELPDELILDPVDAKILGVKPKETKFAASFAVPTAAVAKFRCGYYETDPKTRKRAFEQYRGGAGQSFPPIP